MSVLRVVIFTQGGLGVAIARGISELPGAEIAGIYLECPVPPHRSLQTRMRRSIKYYGYLGMMRRMISGVWKRFRTAQALMGTDDSDALEQIASKCSATFMTASDLHDEKVLESIRSTKPDLGLVIGTTIVRPCLYGLPCMGSLNLHQGKTPEYRGSSPVFWALYDGVSEYGVTIHQVVDRVDAGDVLLEGVVPFTYNYDRFGIDFEAFSRDFYSSINPLSVELMIEAVKRMAAGTFRFTKQDEQSAIRRRHPTYAEKRMLKRILKQRLSAAKRRKSGTIGIV